MTTQSSDLKNLNVLSIGFGKAGSQLHLPSWIEQGANIIAYDQDEQRLNPAIFPPEAKAAFENGRLTGVHSLSELATMPDVIDIVTSSGHHVEAIEAALAAIDKFGSSPKAWLIEKPIASHIQEADQLRALIKSKQLDVSSVFVNENYLASRGLESLRKLIETEKSRGNYLRGIDVVFYKNRVPDVLNNRFTDPTLGAFGIELPHQLAIAYNLAGIGPDSNVTVERNEYYADVQGIAHSEATYTVMKTKDGTVMRLAQGLGPFTIDADGEMRAADEPGVSRYVVTRFADGRAAKVLFDPAPGIERFHSVVRWQDENGESNERIIADNTVQRVIKSVTDYALGVDREPYTEGLNVPNALNYAAALLNLRHTAMNK